MSKATNDEIDLLDLFKRMGRTISKWFNAIGKAFLVSGIFLIKNIFYLLFSILIGIGISYFVKWITKPFYVSEVTFRNKQEAFRVFLQGKDHSKL